MKQITKFFGIAIVMLAFSAATFAQSATANASATIVTPISIAKVVGADMFFGNVAVSTIGGTVVLSPAGARSVTGDVTLPAITGTVQAASFDVSGTAAMTYDITLPAGATTITSGANTMDVDTWTTDGTGTLDGSGQETINVGATLNVDPSQAGGTYTSGTAFTVSVNYN
jgi:hypothetical protein